MIVALAGRRIDEVDADYVRFPLKNLRIVKDRIKNELTKIDCKSIVCAGACGSDLLALEVAGEMNIHRTMILPYNSTEFKKNSVSDRPGNWSKLFDKIYEQLIISNDVTVLEYKSDDSDVFKKTNLDILRKATSMSENINDIVAIVVWEGKSRGRNDITALFQKQAKDIQLQILEVLTN